jgi:hypothetical protein
VNDLPEHRINAQQRKKVLRHGNARHPFRLAGSRQLPVSGAIVAGPPGQIGEGTILLPQVQEVTHLSGPFLVRNPNQTARIAEREGPQQERIHDAEHSRTSPDAEAGDENHKCGERGIAPHPSKRVAQILCQIAPPANQPHAAGFF